MKTFKTLWICLVTVLVINGCDNKEISQLRNTAKEPPKTAEARYNLGLALKGKDKE